MNLFAQTPAIPDPGGWTDFIVKVGVPGSMAFVFFLALVWVVRRYLPDPKDYQHRILSQRRRDAKAMRLTASVLETIGEKVGADVKRDCEQIREILSRDADPDDEDDDTATKP